MAALLTFNASQLSPTATTQDVPFGEVIKIVHVPLSDARTSSMLPLAAKPMATGFSLCCEDNLSRKLVLVLHTVAAWLGLCHMAPDTVVKGARTARHFRILDIIACRSKWQLPPCNKRITGGTEERTVGRVNLRNG